MQYESPNQAPPVLERFPYYIFALVADNDLSHDVVTNIKNRNLLVRLRTGELALAIGSHIRNDPADDTLATIGCSAEDCDIVIDDASCTLSHTQCAFRIKDETGAVMLYDLSTEGDMLVSGRGVPGHDFNRMLKPRKIMIHNHFNNVFSMGGTKRDLYRFLVAWRPLDAGENGDEKCRKAMQFIRNKAPVMREVQTEYGADFVSAHQVDFDSDLDSMAGYDNSEPLLDSRKWYRELDTANVAEAVKNDLTWPMTNREFTPGGVFMVKKQRPVAIR